MEVIQVWYGYSGYGKGKELEVLEALLQRVSTPRVTGDVDEADLDTILQAALRAPDHGQLRPWKFLVVRGPSRERLGALFARARLTEDPDISAVDLEKVKRKPMRAPVIVIAVATVSPHPGVPEVEQIVSTGAAVQNMLLAAFSMGIGGMWRTGSMAYSEIVRDGLGLGENDRIVGFLYLGQVQGKTRTPGKLDIRKFVTEWKG